MHQIFNFPLLKKILKDCFIFNVPFVRDKTALLLVDTINHCKCKNILEIGTAIGYSAAIMALNTKATIDTIECDEQKYQLAFNHLKDIKNVNLIKGDCFNHLFPSIYDFIFIDGPKSNQIELIQYLEKFMSDNCIILIDNIYMKKFRDKLYKTTNQIKILKAIDNLIEWIKNQKQFKYKILDVDDGVAILWRTRKWS